MRSGKNAQKKTFDRKATAFIRNEVEGIQGHTIVSVSILYKLIISDKYTALSSKPTFFLTHKSPCRVNSPIVPMLLDNDIEAIIRGVFTCKQRDKIMRQSFKEDTQRSIDLTDR